MGFMKEHISWPRVLGFFLLTMLLLTLMSRAADSILLPVVKCARPAAGPLTHRVTVGGTIEARELRPVMAEPNLPVARVHVRAGQAVKAGDALLSYDAEVLQRQLNEKRAELEKFNLKARLDALEQPAEDKGGKEKAQLSQQLNKLEIDAAQRAVDRLTQLSGGGATLVAPVDGTVSELLVKPGDSAQGAALRLSPAASGLMARAVVTADQAKHLAVGMAATFRRSGDTRATEGAGLIGLSPTAEGHEASFALPDGAGGIGQAISITTELKTDSYAVRVPLGAIASSNGQTGVYRIRTGETVLGAMEYAEFVPVTLIESDLEYAAISGTLMDRDQVIVSSNKPLSAGDRVRSAS